MRSWSETDSARYAGPRPINTVSAPVVSGREDGGRRMNTELCVCVGLARSMVHETT